MWFLSNVIFTTVLWIYCGDLSTVEIIGKHIVANYAVTKVVVNDPPVYEFEVEFNSPAHSKYWKQVFNWRKDNGLSMFEKIEFHCDSI